MVTPPASGTEPATASRSAASASRPMPDQPRDGGPGRVALPVEAVGRRARHLPGHRGRQPVGAPARRGPGGHEEEGAGAVGALGLPGGQAALADQRRLLVHGQTGDGQGRPEGRGRRRPGWRSPPPRAGRPAPGRRAPTASADQVRRVEVEYQGARRRGHVGHEPPVELVEQPGVRGGGHPVGGPVAPQPGQLRRREVRVERQAGDVGQPVARGRPARRSRSRPAGPARTRRW